MNCTYYFYLHTWVYTPKRSIANISQIARAKILCIVLILRTPKILHPTSCTAERLIPGIRVRIVGGLSLTNVYIRRNTCTGNRASSSRKTNRELLSCSLSMWDSPSEVYSLYDSSLNLDNVLANPFECPWWPEPVKPCQTGSIRIATPNCIV